MAIPKNKKSECFRRALIMQWNGFKRGETVQRYEVVRNVSAQMGIKQETVRRYLATTDFWGMLERAGSIAAMIQELGYWEDVVGFPNSRGIHITKTCRIRRARKQRTIAKYSKM